MAKATAPLFAVEASGQIGQTVVYDKRGYVRIYAKPSNPKTDAQGNVRTAFRATSAIVEAIGGHARGDIRTAAEPAYRWNAWLVRQMIGKGMANWNHYNDAFDALTDAQKDDWNTQAEDKHITPQPMPYDAAPIDRLPGRALWAAANAIARIPKGPGDPTGDNAAAWAQYITEP